MKLRFVVHNLPPKKGGENSMWGKSVEIPRLKALRLAAFQALENRPIPPGSIRMNLRLYAFPSHGDLDNFIAGICDGLMAAHRNTPVDWSSWADMPEKINPDKHILFKDDAVITRIVAERFTPDAELFYELEFEWLKYQVYLGEQSSWIQIFDYSAHIPGDNELEIHAQVTDPAKL